MADKPLFNLDADERWRLAYNSQQWILQVRRAGKPVVRHPQGGQVLDKRFRAVAFVGGKKATLTRLPDNFPTFIAAPERFFARPEAEAA